MNPKISSLDGTFELAKMESLDTGTMRGTVRSLQDGGLQDVVMNPSPYFGVMPKVGEVVGIYRRHGWYARYLFPVARLNNAPVLDKLEDESEPGDVPKTMDPGDMYVGCKARMYFDDGGNSDWTNFAGNLSIQLNDSTSRINLTANNYTFSTPGNGIRIITTSSVPTTFGDEISIQKNAPLPTLPEELTNFVPTTLTELSSISIDAMGGIKLSSIAGLATLRLSAGSLPLDPFTPGNIRLENPLASLKIDATGDFRLSNNFGRLDVSLAGDIDLANLLCRLEMGADQSLILSNTAASLTFSNAGIVTLASTSEVVVNAGTSLTLLAKPAVLVQAPTVDITAGTAFTLTSPIITLAGFPSFVGLPASVPLIGATAIALIPVMVNGVPVGSIPVIS